MTEFEEYDDCDNTDGEQVGTCPEKEKEKLTDDMSMFQCPIAPAAFPGYDELAQAFAKTRDDKYFLWILHFHEAGMTEKCRRQIDRSFLSHGMADLKNAYALGLYKALKLYDPEKGTPFMVFKEDYVSEALAEETGRLLPGYSMRNTGEYRQLKRIMAIYRKYADEPFDQAIKKIAEEMRLSVKTATEIILAALRLSNPMPLFMTVTDEDGNEVEEDYIPSHEPTPEQRLFDECRTEALWSAFERLPLLERMIVAESCGFCVDCYGVFILAENEYGSRTVQKRLPMMNTGIAVRHQLSVRTVSDKLNKAYKKLREYLRETDWFADWDYERGAAIENNRNERRRRHLEEHTREGSQQ